VAAGVSGEAFDRDPRRRPTRPLTPGACSVAGCHSELHSSGVCFRHERAWRRSDIPVEEFIAQAQPLERLASCMVAGCGRERVYRRGLCWFHDQRLRRRRRLGPLSDDDVAAWAAGENPRLGAHQFSMAGLGELARVELLYALQRRDETPPPLDPMQVRILIGRLNGAGSLRHPDVDGVCEIGGMQSN